MLMLVSVKVPPLTRRLEITLEKTQQKKSKMCESNEEGGRDAVALGLNIYILFGQRTLNLVGIRNYLLSQLYQLCGPGKILPPL